LIVDDSAFMRRAISRVLDADPGITVVGTARNGQQSVELAKSLKPDVVTMDVEMPVMDGLTALKVIMHECPTHVIMVSSLTTEGSDAALNAMKLGAVDVFAKDSPSVTSDIVSMQKDLVARVKALGGSRRFKQRPAQLGTSCAVSMAPRFVKGQFDLVCIGSSTGGPPVLEEIVCGCPGELSIPVIVAQHMPTVFTASMAKRLDRLAGLHVVHGEHRMELQGGTVYIAPGGQHTHVERSAGNNLTLKMSDKPDDASYRPSVDVLFSTSTLAVNGRALGIILTGMGSDGARGAQELVKAGGVVLTQSEETCVVYGMPKAVDQAGVSKASLPPARIVESLRTLVPTRAAA